ncbi:MAG TPA: tRNA 2-thiouridine(34) synthase MnmA [Thermoleophilaceae bacterium]|nr:tRNA 2-thiouridine(34) synthase MnmA [Thermoleophilaceae bacterium]
MGDRETYEDHLTAPRGLGALRGAPHSGAAGGAACGDLVRVSVCVEDGMIARAGFDAEGCGAATAAGSAAVECVLGRSVLDAARVGARDIADALGGLAPGKMHAADLAADALHRALGRAALEASLPQAPARTLVGMSGGVDSTVVAHLAGPEAVGVTLELWGDPENDGERSCCSAQAVLSARALAHGMGLPHFTLDARERFRAEVVDDFVAGYEGGSTPNPCVRCNGLVRFDAMLRLAGALGAPRLATGHYARIADGPLLMAARDTNKDQSYMLARLTPPELERLSFPLGELTKPEVRRIARGAGLPVADRPDSQDLCFLAGTRRDRFLRRHGRRRPAAGEIVTVDGRPLGSHSGHEGFTVGQRRGLGLAAGEPLYVVGKDAAANRVIVGPRSALTTVRIPVEGVRLLRDTAEINRVKLRYRQAPVGCRAAPADDRDAIELRLDEPLDGGAAPGQLACLMSGDLVVGWGTIGEAATRAA